MESLKPEVYWIGNRCYRVNPCHNFSNSSQSANFNYIPSTNGEPNFDGGVPSNTDTTTVKPYVEVDEFEDALTGDEDVANLQLDESIEIIKEDNGCKAFSCIPSSLFSHVIGSKGLVKKRIETETRTRIYVPRQNERGDIVIRGQSENDVRKAYKRLNQIALNARFKRDATHFTCFQMNDSSIINKMNEFKDLVLTNCAMSARGLDANIFQEAEKLHLTISIMVLLDERERKCAADILTSLGPEINQITEGKPVKISLKGLEIMNDDPSQVDVLYAKCIPAENRDALQKIANLVATKFSEKQLGKEMRGQQVKLHCTLINSRYRNKTGDDEDVLGARKQDDNRRKNKNFTPRESFDARQLLQKYGEFDFGEVTVTNVKIATRHTKGPDGFYKCYSSINI